MGSVYHNQIIKFGTITLPSIFSTSTRIKLVIYNLCYGSLLTTFSNVISLHSTPTCYTFAWQKEKVDTARLQDWNGHYILKKRSELRCGDIRKCPIDFSLFWWKTRAGNCLHTKTQCCNAELIVSVVERKMLSLLDLHNESMVFM